MVHLPSFVATTALLLSLVSAAAVLPTYDVEDSGIAIRQTSYGLCPTCMGVYYCKEPDWKGACSHPKIMERQCINLYPDFDEQISSFGPDNRMTCIVYKDKHCKGDSKQLYYPGYANLNDVGYDNVISSYNCWVMK